jgi:carbamoyltransferase
MLILGVSAFYHDAAAALVDDGRIVAAAQEERFSRKKHDAGFPARAASYCLDQAGIGLDDLECVVFYDKPLLKFERLLETYVAFAPRGFRSFAAAVPVWLKEKLFQKKLILEQLRRLDGRGIPRGRLLFSEHHLSHAASAFFASPFEEAAVLTLDGVGEWATTTFSVGRENRLELLRELRFPHSLGLLYSAFTYHAGFKVNSGEYKLMGLAPYGEPTYARRILDHLVDVKDDGTFWLDQDYFDYCTGLTMTNGRFAALFDGPPRKPESPITRREMDLAASIQAVTEEILLRLARALRRETGLKNLCLAGGVALNCVANGKLLRSGVFDRIWIQPAAGDAGGAVGAALAAYHLHYGQRREIPPSDGMEGCYLGPSFEQAEIERRLSTCGARFRVLPDDRLLSECVRELRDGKALGWFQGRMEFGPRALGARSILADARSPHMQAALNMKVKFRESFRPFAPAVLREDLQHWFDLDIDSAYMLFVADVAARHRLTDESESGRSGLERLKQPLSTIPAVTHVDYSARLQTVHRGTNPRFHALISAFKDLTGCPVLVNTSFNVRGEPIVCTPEEAFRCFMGTDIDSLAVGNCHLRKTEQDPGKRADYHTRFEPD